jgi:hypothetical protein
MALSNGCSNATMSNSETEPNSRGRHFNERKPPDKFSPGRSTHWPALGDTHRPGLLAKKSLSTVNWPILV